MSVIYNVQSQLGWQSHTGGNIGGDPAKIYNMDQNNPPSAVFFVQGCTKPGGYANVEWYNKFAIPFGSNQLCFSYDITLDTNSLQYCQADEMDIILTDANGYNYNGSTQINYASGGQLQIAGPTGSWVNTGFTPGKYAPNIVHHVQIFYSFDLVGRTISTTAIVIDNQLYIIPTALQNLSAHNAGWTDYMMAMVQIQMDLNNQAQQYTKTINNGNLTFSGPS